MSHLLHLVFSFWVFSPRSEVQPAQLGPAQQQPQQQQDILQLMQYSMSAAFGETCTHWQGTLWVRLRERMRTEAQQRWPHWKITWEGWCTWNLAHSFPRVSGNPRLPSTVFCDAKRAGKGGDEWQKSPVGFPGRFVLQSSRMRAQKSPFSLQCYNKKHYLPNCNNW